MVHASWLKGARPGPQGRRPPAGSLTINSRLINELFDYLLWVLVINRLVNASNWLFKPLLG